MRSGLSIESYKVGAFPFFIDLEVGQLVGKGTKYLLSEENYFESSYGHIGYFGI